MVSPYLTQGDIRLEFRVWRGSRALDGIWRRGCEQPINAKAAAARNTRAEPTDESQASNDKQIRPAFTEMEPADVFTVCIQK